MNLSRASRIDTKAPLSGELDMNSKILKLSILTIFFLFAISAFFFSGASIGAQNTRRAILENVRDYKTWKQVTKPPENSPGQPAAIAFDQVVQVDLSSVAG
jgi:hypothetical protein